MPEIIQLIGMSNKNSEKVVKKIVDLSDRILKVNMHSSKLQKLEKIVLREEAPEKPYKYSPRIKHRKTSSLHFPTPDGNQIINLPKLPFGAHSDYNEEGKRGDFSRNHFYEYDSIPSDKEKDIFCLHKQANLALKTANPPKKYEVSFSPKKFEFNTKGGRLICKKNEGVINAYEEEVRKIRLQLHFIQTFRTFNKKINPIS